MENLFTHLKQEQILLLLLLNFRLNYTLYHLDSQTPPYSNPDLVHIANQIVKSHQEDRAVIWMMGAHVMRRGNSRFIIDLMNRGILTHLATNGATAIHDFELALIGATLENVEDYIQDGQFGHW